MIILDSYYSAGRSPKAEQNFNRNMSLGSKMAGGRMLPFKQNVCMLDDGVRLLREDGKIYIFRYR